MSTSITHRHVFVMMYCFTSISPYATCFGYSVNHSLLCTDTRFTVTLDKENYCIIQTYMSPVIGYDRSFIQILIAFYHTHTHTHTHTHQIKAWGECKCRYIYFYFCEHKSHTRCVNAVIQLIWHKHKFYYIESWKIHFDFFSVRNMQRNGHLIASTHG